jgi:ribosomal protein L37E
VIDKKRVQSYCFNMLKAKILVGLLSFLAIGIRITTAQNYQGKNERPVTFVCSYCGSQSSTPIQGAACGFGDGKDHNWMPVR